MPRLGVYTIVFNMADLISSDESIKNDALHYLHFWLHSIETHASAKSNPPVFLVGSHLDSIKSTDLTQINEILGNTFKDILGRLNIHNDSQVLFFFPVDNTNAADKNVAKLRSDLVDAVKKDPLAYLEDPIPVTWLKTADALAELGKHEPILPLLSTHPPSVISVMKENGALDDGLKESDQMQRAIAMLQFFHLLGVVVFFGDVPGMQNKVILSPQWIIDNITYIIRDFQLHRFGRDRRAMELPGDDGKKGGAWTNLIQCGVLASPLLTRLWVGESENQKYLELLMQKLGLFVELPTKTYDNKIKYLVPCTVSAISMNTTAEALDATKYLEDTSIHACSFNFESFLPNGFYERVVNQLVQEWPLGYEKNDPRLLSNGAELWLGPNHKFVLKLDKSKRVITAVTQKEHAEGILTHVAEAFKTVNKQVYKEKLDYTLNGMLKGGRQLRIDNGVQRARRRTSVDSQKPSTSSTETQEAEAALFSLFREDAGLPKSKAHEYAVLLSKEEVDLCSLKLRYEFCATTNDFKRFEGILKDYGIARDGDRMQITAAVAKLPEQEKPSPYLMGFFGGDELDFVKQEKDTITHSVAHANLKSQMTMPMGTVEALREKLQSEEACGSKVLHLAMHGHTKTRAGRYTLAFEEKNAGEKVEPEILAKTIASFCDREVCEKGRSGTIECVVINSCYGAEIAKILKEKQHQVPWVVSWETAVDDQAALTFAEDFYATLAQKGNKQNFNNAFERAVSNLELRGWVIHADRGGDPGTAEGKERLAALQKEEQNPLLKAAGIPKLYPPEDSKAWEEKKEKEKTGGVLGADKIVEALAGVESRLTQVVKESAAKIIQMNQETAEKLKHSTSVICKAVFEATEVSTPTCFVVLPYELPAPKSLTEEISPTLESQLKKANDWLTGVMGLVEKGKCIVKSPGAYAKCYVTDKFKDKVKKLKEACTSKKLYLYLVDEFTGEAVYDPTCVYPVEMEASSELVEKYMPIMQMGLQAISLANGVTGLVNMFFPFVPRKLVPPKYEERMQEFVNGLNKEPDYEKDDGVPKRGLELREFKEFLEKHEEDFLKKTKEKKVKHRNYAGLMRVCDEKTGHAIWVTEESVKLIESGERKDEDAAKPQSSAAGAGAGSAEEAPLLLVERGAVGLPSGWMRHAQKEGSTDGPYLEDAEEYPMTEGAPPQCTPSSWHTDQVAAWLAGIGEAYVDYGTAFVKNGISGEELLQEDFGLGELEEMGVTSKMHQKRILREIKKLS
jgi:hypothetical protein